MGRFGDFFKRVKINEDNMPITKSDNTQKVQIHIEGNINLFKDEEDLL